MYSIRKFLNEIALQNELKSEVLSVYVRTNFNAYSAFMTGIMSQKNPFDSFMNLSKAIGEDKRGIKILTVYLECARRCLLNYQNEGIGKEIYIDTMKCFVRFAQEYYQKNGCYGFPCPWWAYRQLNMTIFRLGALEFEFDDSKQTPEIGIHIPSDADFREQSVNESIRQCKTFVVKHRPKFISAKYSCHSWLLSPHLASILNENSNIKRFQKMFCVTEVFENETQYIENIFHTDADTPISELAENTSLQRGVKELMKQSVNLGAAYGIMKE